MASTLIQPQNSPNLMGKNYEVALDQSIQNVLDSLYNRINLPKDFTLNFHQLLRSKINPPLETIWIYSALSYRNANSPKLEPWDHLSAIKDLFQLIISCSASCSTLKCALLIAPVVYELHKLIVDLKGFELSLKREKIVKREIKVLVCSILGYVNVGCEGLDGTYDGREQKLVCPLEDLVRIWVGDWGVENGSKVGSLREFFPLLDGDFVEGVCVEGCELNELAGLVMAEVFLLRLCLEVREGCLTKELQNELRAWIVGSITGLHDSYFFWNLLMMLLQPFLPVSSLLDPEAEMFLRKILYDAVLLVEYSFLKPERLANLPAKHVKRIVISRLLVIHEATELLRKIGEEHTKVNSYVSAFSGSALPSQLLKWVRNEIGLDVKANGPDGTSPKAFLRWILNLENRGLRIFDSEMSKSRAKLILDNLIEYTDHPVHKENGKNSDADFFIDKGGDQGNEEDENMITSTSIAFIAAAQSMHLAERGGLKRKAKDVGKKKQAKSLKYDHHENSGSELERSASSCGDSSSDSEVDNLSSDEEKEQQGLA